MNDTYRQTIVEYEHKIISSMINRYDDIAGAIDGLSHTHFTVQKNKLDAEIKDTEKKKEQEKIVTEN